MRCGESNNKLRPIARLDINTDGFVINPFESAYALRTALNVAIISKGLKNITRRNQARSLSH